MFGLCRVCSSAIEGLAALMNINSEQQSGDAGAAINLPAGMNPSRISVCKRYLYLHWSVPLPSPNDILMG